MAPANDEAMPMATNEEAAPKRMITILSQDKEAFVVEKGVATMATLIEDLLAGTLCDTCWYHAEPWHGHVGGLRLGGWVLCSLCRCQCHFVRVFGDGVVAQWLFQSYALACASIGVGSARV